jgi:DHA1 family bicyclomycin/chloramphenicol resistance-like MFS transporter
MTRTLTEKHTQFIIWTLLCLMPIVGMGVDLIAPSLPAIASSLHASRGMAKNLISIYILGYALGNFFAGFMTDAVGRQKLIRLGLLSITLVSLLPLFFPSIHILLLSRFLQGVMIGVTAVVIRAIFSDILPPEKLTRLGTLMGTMWGLGPVIGPVIGGYLQFYLGWEAIFWFFVLIAFIGFIAAFLVVPETHFNRHPLNIKIIKNNMAEVLSHRLFMGLVILTGLGYGLIIVFNTVGPFLIQEKLHYSSVFFGHLSLCLGLAFLLATFVCRYFLKKYTTKQLFFTVINVFFLISIASVVLSYFFETSIVFVAIASAIMYFANGFIFPMSLGKGLSLFRHIAGTATSLMYLINMGITSVIAFLVSFVNIHNASHLMWLYFGLLLLSVMVYWGMLREE